MLKLYIVMIVGGQIGVVAGPLNYTPQACRDKAAELQLAVQVTVAGLGGTITGAARISCIQSASRPQLYTRR